MSKPDLTKKATEKAAKPPKPAKVAAKKQPKEFNREAEEAALIKKYPKQNIVKGSLKNAGEVPGFKQKRTIEIVCQGDNKTKRRIATSDLHQVKYSEEYIKRLRLDRRKKLRAAKPKATKVTKATEKKPAVKKPTARKPVTAQPIESAKG